MPVPEDILVRPANHSDEAAIVDICYETASIDVAEEQKYAFALRWALPYLRHFPQCCFVAELGNQVVGYIVGTPDTQAQVDLFTRHELPEIQTLVSKRTPLANSFLNGGTLDPTVADILADYPAHLHINLTSACRGLGVGARLMAELEFQLQEQGIQGMHLGVAKQNMSAVKFYQHQGYTLREGEPDDFSTAWIMTKHL